MRSDLKILVDEARSLLLKHSFPYVFEEEVLGWRVQAHFDNALLCEDILDFTSVTYGAKDFAEGSPHQSIWCCAESSIELMTIARALRKGMQDEPPFALLKYKETVVDFGRKVSLPDCLAVHNLTTDTVYLISRNTGDTIMICKPANRLPGEVHRYIRTVFTFVLQANDYSMVHASACQCGDCAVIIVGPNGAGKTTVLLSLMESGHANYLSSDKVLLKVSNQSLEIQGHPDDVRVRIGTLSYFPRLQEFIPLEYRDMSSEEVWEISDKIRLHPREVRRLWKIGQFGTYSCVKVLVTSFDPSKPFLIEGLSPSEARSSLDAFVITGSERNIPWMEPPILPTNLESRVERFKSELCSSQNVSFHRLSIGTIWNTQAISTQVIDNLGLNKIQPFN